MRLINNRNFLVSYCRSVELTVLLFKKQNFNSKYLCSIPLPRPEGFIKNELTELETNKNLFINKNLVS